MSKVEGSSSYARNKDFLVRLFSHAYNGNWACLIACVAAGVDGIHEKTQEEENCKKFGMEKHGKQYIPEDVQSVLSCRDGRQWNVLHFAAAGGNLDVMRNILMLDSDMANLKDSEEGVTPLMLAARHGHLEACKLLVEFSPDCLLFCADDGKMVLHFAVQGKNVDCVKFFLNNNIDIFHKAKSVGSATYWCISSYVEQILCNSNDDSSALYLNVLKVLLSHNPDMLGAPEGFPPPLCLASAVGEESLVNLLLCAGSDIFVRDAEGWTPLHLAAEGGHTGVARRILEEGQSKKDELLALRNKGCTAMDVALKSGHSDVVALFRSYGIKQDEALPDEFSDTLKEESDSQTSLKEGEEFSKDLSVEDQEFEENSPCIPACSIVNLQKVDQKKSEANEYVKQKKFSLAAKLYKSAYDTCCHCNRFRETRSVLQSNLSFCLKHLGDYKEALACSHKSICLNPKWFKGYLRASEVCEAMKNYEEAAQVLWEAILRLPDSDPLKGTLRSKFVCLVNLAKNNYGNDQTPKNI